MTTATTGHAAAVPAVAVLPQVADVPDLCVGPIGALCATGPLGGLGGTVGAGVGGVGQAAAGWAMAGLGAMFVDGARDATAAVLAALDTTTRVNLSADWFQANVGVLAAVTLPVLVGLFALQVTAAVLRREPGGLARAVVGVAKALLGSAIALAVTQSALVACDEIAAAIAAAAGTTVTDAARRFLELSYLAGPSAGPALQILLGLAVIVGSFLLWAVLLFRKAALLLVAVFAPVAFAGAAFDHTRAWVRRWVELVAALVFCKVVIVVVFVVGLAAFGTTGTTGDTGSTGSPGTTGSTGSTASAAGGAALSDLLVGLVLLGIAAFSPWLSWRFIHFTGAEVTDAVHATLGSAARSPLPGATRAAGRTARHVAVAAAARPLVGAALSGVRGAGLSRGPAGGRPTIPAGPGSPAPGPAAGPALPASGPAASASRRPPGPPGWTGAGGAPPRGGERP